MYSWLARKRMFADVQRVCAKERPCDDEVSHYPYGWRCQLKCLQLEVHFLGIYLKSVFGLELAVWGLKPVFFFSFSSDFQHSSGFSRQGLLRAQ